jgi:hypothetical protein
MYWQVIVRRESAKLGANLEDIINFAEVQTISIYHHRLIFGFLIDDICNILF